MIVIAAIAMPGGWLVMPLLDAIAWAYVIWLWAIGVLSVR